MKHAILGSFALFMLAGVSVTARAEVIKLATLIPTGSSWYAPLRDMAESWHTASGGEIKVRIYAGGVAGDDPEVVRKMRIGQLHAATVTTQGLRKIVPDIIALHLPMMLRSSDELDYVRQQVLPELRTRIESKGFVVLNWADAGWVRFFCKKPVVHPDDLKPLRIFVWSGNTLVAKAWRDAGYLPVPLAATDILGALQSGLIDCVPTVPIAALSYQWFGLAPHMTDIKWTPFTGATVVSSRTWRKIPKGMRKRLRAIAEDTGRRLKSRTRELDRQSIEMMQKYGLKVHKVPADVIPAWETRARNAYPPFVGSIVSPAFLSTVERHREDFRRNSR